MNIPACQKIADKWIPLPMATKPRGCSPSYKSLAVRLKTLAVRVKTPAPISYKTHE